MHRDPESMPDPSSSWPGARQGSMVWPEALAVHGGGRGLVLAVLLALAPGCALHKARSAFDQGRYDEAILEYRKILKKDPSDAEARLGLMRTAPLAAEAHLAKARTAKKAGRLEAEQQEVAAAVLLDPSNAVAVDWMTHLEEDAAKRRAEEDDEDSVDKARAQGDAKPALRLDPKSMEGLDLNFTRRTNLKEVFATLSKASGVNIVLHASASALDLGVIVDLRGLDFQHILDALMLQNDLFYKVLDPNTIMVFKKSPQNLAEHENKVIKTFYLSNADGEAVRQILTTIAPQMRLFIDKRLNAITVQARSSDLAVATRIVNQLDKAKAEVVLYLELLEVSSTAAQAVGLLPAVSTDPLATKGLYRITAGPTDVFNGGQVPSLKVSRSNLLILFPGLALDLLKTNGETRMLANPNVRVISGETGVVNIGQKISTTQSSLSTTATLAGAAGLPAQTSYSYEDVGVNITVKPRVHFNGDITVDLESKVINQVPSTAQGRPNFGQRILKTTARLRDGETAVFGGLLKDEGNQNRQGVWGLQDVPVLGKLLGNTRGDRTLTDVILSLRAVVVRKPDLAEGDFLPFNPDLAPGIPKPFGSYTSISSDSLTSLPPGPGQPDPPGNN